MPRLTGKNAALYIGADALGSTTFAWVADLFEWIVEVRAITFAGSIKADTFDRRVASHLEGRLTARRYVQALSALASNVLVSRPALDGVTHAFTSGARIQWAVVAVDTGFPTGGNANNYSTAVVHAQGTGYVDRGHLGAPRTQVEDDFELIIDSLVSMG